MRTYQTLKNPLYTNGIALGGGAILGAAHIGVIKALEEQNIRIDYISGTSIGAFIAALYAFNTPIDEIEELALSLDWADITSLKISKLSLFSNKKLGHIIEQKLGKKQIEDANIPLAIIAANIANGEKVSLLSGSVSEAVMASACLPAIYSPVIINEQALVDGGIVENVPVSALINFQADNLIAVDLAIKAKYNEPNDVFDVISNAISIAIDNNTKNYTQVADLCIAPNVESKSRTNTDRQEIEHLIALGYEAAHEVLHSKLNFKSLLLFYKKQLKRKLLL